MRIKKRIKKIDHKKKIVLILEIINDKFMKEKKEKITKFTIRELGGAFGDWGTLIPFIIGYISISGLNPSGIFLCLGITNIVLGIRYNLPLPVQPQKLIGAIAISEK